MPTGEPGQATAPARPMALGRRHVLVGAGDDERGEPSVAVWLADQDGSPLAGWVIARVRAFADPATARRLLAAAAQGVLVGTPVEPGTPALVEILDGLSRAAGVPRGHARRAVVETGLVVAELSRYRDRYTRVVPDWSAPVPPVPPATGGRCPVVAGVLAAAATLRWCAAAWRAMEARRWQDPVLRRRFGPVRCLPPYWHSVSSTSPGSTGWSPAGRADAAAVDPPVTRPRRPVRHHPYAWRGAPGARGSRSRRAGAR